MHPWETSVPVLLPALLRPLREAAFPSNLHPVDERLDLNRICLSLCRLRDAMRRISRPHLVDPSQHLFHLSPVEKRPSHSQPNPVDRGLCLPRSIHPSQIPGTSHMIAHGWRLCQSPAEKRPRNRYLSPVEQGLCLPRTMCPGGGRVRSP